jgi:hypothetical protein
MDVVVGWVLDVRLSEQEMFCVELFSLAWLLATGLLFSNPPMKLEFLKVEDAIDRWVPDVRLSKQ